MFAAALVLGGIFAQQYINSKSVSFIKFQQFEEIFKESCSCERIESDYNSFFCTYRRNVQLEKPRRIPSWKAERPKSAMWIMTGCPNRLSDRLVSFSDRLVLGILSNQSSCIFLQVNHQRSRLLRHTPLNSHQKPRSEVEKHSPFCLFSDMFFNELIITVWWLANLLHCAYSARNFYQS